MPENDSIQRLLLLRRLTRAIADMLRAELREHLTTLAPLFRPSTVLGEQVQTGARPTIQGSDRVFQELQALHDKVAASRMYDLPRLLKVPLEVTSATPELTPVEYTHEARTDRERKTVTVIPPLQWVLSYAGFPPSGLRGLLATRTRGAGELPQYVLHYLVLHLVVMRQPGLLKILEGLHFRVRSEPMAGSGDLPITVLSATVATRRPADPVIIESTEVSGMNTFEEVVDLDDLGRLREPFKERLLEVVRSHGTDLLPPR